MKIKIHENIGIKGMVTLRSHPAGTIDRIVELRKAGRHDEANAIVKQGKIHSEKHNTVVYYAGAGYDILVQFLLSAYAGIFNFPLGLAWGEIGTGIAPSLAPVPATGASGVLTGAYQYLVTFTTSLGETTAGPASAVVNPSAQQVGLTSIPTGIGGTVTGRKIYRTKAGGTTFFLLTTIADNTTLTYTDNATDGSLPATNPPTTSTAGSIATTTNDAALQTPSNRGAVAYGADIGYAQATVQFYFPDALLTNMTYYEAGSFIGGTSALNSGGMFNHALFGSAYTKVTGTDTTIEMDFAFS